MQALQIYCIDSEHHQVCARDLKYLSLVVVPIECRFRYRQRLQVIIRDQKSLNIRNLSRPLDLEFSRRRMS